VQGMWYGAVLEALLKRVRDLGGDGEGEGASSRTRVLRDMLQVRGLLGTATAPTAQTPSPHRSEPAPFLLPAVMQSTRQMLCWHPVSTSVVGQSPAMHSPLPTPTRLRAWRTARDLPHSACQTILKSFRSFRFESSPT
jgi:hypothetical protein